jgi:hypothetical protein
MPVIRPSRRASLLGTACLLAALGAYLAPPGRAADRPRVLPGADPVPIVHPPSGPNRGHAVTFDPNVMSIEQLVNKIVEVKNRKDDLEKLQKQLIELVDRKLAEQQERLKKLGVRPGDKPEKLETPPTPTHP